MMTKFKRIGALLGLGLFFLSAPLLAQQSTTRGFNLGVQLQGAALAVEGNDPDGGGGLGLKFGYGVNRIITLFAALDGAQVTADNSPNLTGDWTLGHFDLGARFHFANSLRRWVPYLEAAVGSRAVSVDNARVNGNAVQETSFNGASFTVGGGLSVHMTQSVALDVGLKVSSGEFTKIDVGAVSVGGLDIDATSSRFGVGIVWWP